MGELWLWRAVQEHCVLCGVLALWLGAWLVSRLTLGVCRSSARLDGKTVILTGCDSGIGKEVAFDLARRGARLIMACVELDRANTVRDTIIRDTNNNNVTVKKIDLSRMSSIRTFAEDINRSEKRLDILIHNAGMMFPARTMTAEGLNTIMTINQFGPFLLTHLLIDLLKRTGKSRIVIVASIGHYLGQLDINNLNPVDTEVVPWYHFVCLKRYLDSKIAVVLFAKELARRLEGSGVTANFLHPGLIYSSMVWNPAPQVVSPLMSLAFPFIKTPEQGAQTTIYLAVSEEVEGVSGKHFSDCKEMATSRATNDPDLAKKYWEICERIVQLQPSDPRI